MVHDEKMVQHVISGVTSGGPGAMQPNFKQVELLQLKFYIVLKLQTWCITVIPFYVPARECGDVTFIITMQHENVM